MSLTRREFAEGSLLVVGGMLMNPQRLLPREAVNFWDNFWDNEVPSSGTEKTIRAALEKDPDRLPAVSTRDNILPNEALEAQIRKLTKDHDGITDIEAVANDVTAGDVVNVGIDHSFGPNALAARELAVAVWGKIGKRDFALGVGLFAPDEQGQLDRFSSSAEPTEQALRSLVGDGTPFDGKWFFINTHPPNSNMELFKLLVWAKNNSVRLIATGADVVTPSGTQLSPEDTLKLYNTHEQRAAEILLSEKNRRPDETIFHLVGGVSHIIRKGKWNHGVTTHIEDNGNWNVRAIGFLNPLTDGGAWIPIRKLLKDKGVSRARIAVGNPTWGSANATWPELWPDVEDDGHGYPGLNWLIITVDNHYYDAQKRN